jgi:hypothetical protein
MQSVPIITKIVSSNPAHGKVYSTQHSVLKFVSDLRQVGGFLQFAKRLIDWCLTPTLAIFQLYCGVNILYNISSTTIPLKINLFRCKAKTSNFFFIFKILYLYQYNCIVVEEILYNMFTPQYSWNIAKVGVKHQSINLFASVVILLIFIFQYLTLNPPDWLDQVS